MSRKISNYGGWDEKVQYFKKSSNFKVNQQMIDEILNLRDQIYYDFNISHFREKLKEIHGISLSYETLRQILIKGVLHEPRTKRWILLNIDGLSI
ncbi:MAG TPA: hypothetical protein ENG63_03560 [Candidatus Desulfofervidus auxilii]|uniref:Uncharacterized protein n=1 Tax=Desulfofervidus auxilii TaxID=1621989 RepID=A0A7C0U289_DESA2|nr:hypothetical protein [Candidatus Desulfofervidus auxilii]